MPFQAHMEKQNTLHTFAQADNTRILKFYGGDVIARLLLGIICLLSTACVHPAIQQEKTVI